MKHILIIFLTVISLYGEKHLFANLHTFQADFRQIVDSDGEKLTYRGKIYIKRPDLVLWEYIEPVEKSIYINSRNVMVIEPDLEQVIVKSISERVQLLEILEKSKKLSDGRYTSKFGDRDYLVILKDKKLYRVIYNDELENQVELTFINSYANSEIDSSIFIPKIDSDFDKIYQ
jgi:outer membrane lipoprotein carrier protein